MYIVEENIHSFKHATCSSYSLISNYNCRGKMDMNTHLIRSCPATSYVAAMFHPTIGQCAHQSLSNTTTLELDMIPQGIRVKVGLHIAKVHQPAKPTQ